MNRRTRAGGSSRRGPVRRRRHSHAAKLGGLQPLEPRIAFAVTPALVADINAQPASSLAGEVQGSSFGFSAPTTPEFVTFNGLTIYPADDGALGRELWVSDGTPAGTRLLKDINLTTASDGRPGGSDPADFFISGGTLYFSADDGVHGRELWKTDGTAAGTVLVKDLVAGSAPGHPREFVGLPDGTVLFVCGAGLFKTNGTTAGTVPIDPANTLGFDYSTTSQSGPFGLTRLGSRVLFSGRNNLLSFGTELWATDGTLANTAPLRQSGGTQVDSPRDFTVVIETETIGFGTSAVTFTRDLAFFSAAGGLWRTDGTPSGTVNVSAVEPFSAPVAFGGFTANTGSSTVSGSRLVFAGNDGTTGVAGVELWTIDGSSATTSPTQIADINQTTSGSGSLPTDFRVAGANLFFSADDGVNGRELWKYDGTNVAMVKNVRSGSTKIPPTASQIFPTGQSSALGAAFANDAAPADFDRDGKVDLVVLDAPHGQFGGSPTNDSLRMMRGVGDGAFVPGVTLPLTGFLISPSSIAAADVNNDGFVDVIAARTSVVVASTFFGNGYSVFLGNGDGTFQPERTLQGEGSPDLTLADLDRDGKLDIVTFQGFPAWRKGNGDGAFQPEQLIYNVDPGTGYRVSNGAVADVDSDGAPDVIATNPTDRQVVVLRNRGDGTFEPERFFSAGIIGGSVRVGDVNRDGKPDLLTTGASDVSGGLSVCFSVLLGTGGGMFAAPQTASLPTGVGVNDTALVDVDGDSVLDLVISASDATQNNTNPSAAGVYVLVGRGDGTFLPATQTNALPGFSGSIWVSVADFSGDGRPDVAVANGPDLTTLLNSGFTGIAPAPSDPIPLASSGSTLYFAADDGVHGSELWKTDGTSAGTSLVRDINSGTKPAFLSQASSSTYISAAMLGGQLLFAADDGQHGTELWKSDGTPTGTTLVEDINPTTADGLEGFSSGSGASLSAALFDGAVYFPADDGIHGTELWKRVGDAAPQLVKDLNPDAAIFNGGEPEFVTAGSLLFFTWPRQEPGPHGSFTVTDLWRTDGTEAGTIRLKTGHGGGGLAQLGTKVVFSATDAAADTELWISDGTVAGTTRLKDINPSGSSNPRSLFSFGSLVLFSALDDAHGRELWRTDGTTTGTQRVVDINPSDSGTAASGLVGDPQFTLFGGQVYFVADDGTRGVELWRTDGTTASLVIDINTTTTTDPVDPLATLPGSSFPYALTSFGSVLLFSASDGVNGTSLWKTDGTVVGTALVKNVLPVPSNVRPFRFTVAGGKAFFGASDGTGDRLWQTDGTTAGTTPIPDVDPAYVTRDIGNVLSVGSEVFFSADRRFVDPAKPAGRALFRSDGTVAGTSLVELSPGVSGSQQFPIIATADRLYFAVNDGIHGLELWQLPFDTVPPTVAIVADRASLGVGQTAAVTFTLSEPPAGFAAGAVTVTGGTLTNFTGSGTSYTATFVPQPNFTGAATIRIAAGAFTDAAGNPNTVSPVTTIAVDTVVPTVSIVTDRSSLGIGQTAAVTFTLSETPAGFAAGAVTVTGGTLTNFTGSGTSYTATFVPQPNFTGAATIRIAAGAFTDAAGNPNTASPVTTIAVDTRPPTVLVTLGTQVLGIGQTAAVAFTLDKPSTTFTAGDVTVVGGMLTNFAGSGTTYTATFVPQPNFVGTATIQVAAAAFTDASGNPNLGIPPLPILIDTRPRGVLAVGTAGNLQTASREFAYAASSPTTIRMSGLSAVQSGFFSPRIRLTVTPTDSISTFAVTVLRRSYDPRSRTVSVTLDRAIPVVPAAGTLVLGDANAPAARLIDANTGGLNREVGGADLVAAGYAPAFVTRFQGGLRVAAGDVDGDALPDLAVAPGATPARSTVNFGRSTRLVSLFSGQASAAWPAATVDVSAVFPDGAGEGFFVTLGNVASDSAGSGVRELVVASGRRVAVFEVLVAAGIPSIVPTPLRVVDLEAPGSITAVAAGPLFNPSGFDEIVVASTTGTQRVAGTTTVTVLGGADLQALRSFRIASLVESGPARRKVNVFGRGASLAVGDVDGDGRRDLVLGAGANGLGNFRVLANEFVTASTASSNRAAFSAAIDAQLGNTSRFGHRRPAGPKWKPTGGPDFFTPGDASGPTGSGFNAPLSVATVTGDAATGGKAWVFAALGATNQTGNEVRRLLYASPGTWTKDVSFSQVPGTQSSDSAGRFRPGMGLRLG